MGTTENFNATMRHFAIITICTLCIACDTEKPANGNLPPENKLVPTWPDTRKTTGGSFSITLNPTGGEIAENKHFSLDLHVKSTVTTAGVLEVKVDADMPAHGHGMNTQPEVVAGKEGDYRVDGMLFHMAGEWVITVEVGRQGKMERASFPVQIE